MTANTNGKKRKKEFRQEITGKLEAAFRDLQNGMKEKKFRSAIKRAGKLLSNDLFSKPKKEKRKKVATETLVAEDVGA